MESDCPSESSLSLDVNESGDEDATEKCVFGNKVFEVPQIFCSQEEIFKSVLNLDTWENELTSQHRERLKKFLPSFPEDDEKEKAETVRQLFSEQNFKFGNPVKHVFNRLKDGFLAPDIAEISQALKKAAYREYKNQQQQYFYRLLKDVLISRKKLLDAAHTLPPDQRVNMQQFTAKPKDATLCERTRLRYFSVLQDVREECNALDTSSEDENYPESSPPKVTRKHKKQLQILEASLSPEMTRITSTTALPPGHPGGDHFLNRCLDMIEVSDERYREMLITHKQRRLNEPNHPELDVSKVDLDDLISRSNIAKRPLTKIADGQIKKKCRILEMQDKHVKPSTSDVEKIPKEEKIPICPTVNITQHDDTTTIPNGDVKPLDVLLPAPVIQETEIPPEPVTFKVEVMKDSTENRVPSPLPEAPQYPSCFFSLLRDFFYEVNEQKLPFAKLEEKVRLWQEGPTALLIEWANFQESWSDLVSSALKFLAGDLISILPESFVPFVDYKEKQQLWHWIGSGRDSEEQLFALCHHWLENKDDVSLDALETSQGSPPPPRVTTVWTVRPTSDEEKLSYREQECIRYQNPHKAFTFQVHGYEAVVGPVKGVYGKESGVNKAREHSLLISDRPPFVTILSLVRDAAARLPNGEGTRADICELLKDSQYLAPASDQQIHTVVSGALDRLHYEKDPCVKYDVNRKLWIYLHRNRTEGEFERIHQAQAVAAKARKAVQKSKLPKIKSKDVPRTPPSASMNSLSESSPSMLNVDVTTASTPTSTVHSPRGGTSPRTQGSPKQNHPASSRHLVRSISMPGQAGAKNPVPLIPDNLNPRKAEVSQPSVLPSSALCQPVITSSNLNVSSPQQSTTPSNILPQFQVEGNHSRPPSQGSVQSLPSPKTVIANVNAAQFVNVGSLQVSTAPVEQSLPSSSVPSRIHGVLSVDMKPSSPSFVGQPPVLQPVLSHQSVESTSAPLACITTAAAPSLITSVPTTATKASNTTFTTQNLPNSKTVQGFQTIVIKQEPGSRTASGLSSLPLLSVEEITSTDSSSLGGSPVVARLVHGSQLLSLSNIVAGAAPNATVKPGTAALQNFKIHGGNFNQQMLPSSTINLLPAAQIAGASDIKLPRLALVSQPGCGPETALISSGPIVGQSKLLSINKDALKSADIKDSSVHKDATEAKLANLSVQALGSLRTSVSHEMGHVLSTANPSNHMISSSTVSSSSSVGGSKKTSTVIIASQEMLKPLTPTYVMTTPVTSASVIAAASGVRTGAPLNVRALQGIKVIPVPQSLGANKNVRSQPLLARIIAPSSGISLRSAIPTELVQAHQLKSGTSVNIVHSLRSVTPASHVKKTGVPSSASQEIPSSQPFIIQVQAPKLNDQDDNNL